MKFFSDENSMPVNPTAFMRLLMPNNIGLLRRWIRCLLKKKIVTFAAAMEFAFNRLVLMTPVV